MKTSTSAIPTTTQISNPKNKKKVIIGVVAVLVLIVASLTAWFVWQANQPHPLGDKLEYVGKDSYGYGLSDGPPTTDYYYATDMTVDEAVGYFRGATLYKNTQESISKTSDYTIILLSDKKGPSFALNFYDHGMSINSRKDLMHGKKYLISINAKDYSVASRAL